MLCVPAAAGEPGSAAVFEDAPHLLGRHPGGAVHTLVFSDDGTRLAAVSGSEAVIWDVATGEALAAVPGLRSELRFTARDVLLGSDGQGIHEFHLDQAQAPSPLARLAGDSQTSLDASGQHALWWRYDGSVWLWRAEHGRVDELLRAASVSWGRSSLIGPGGMLVELDAGQLVVGAGAPERSLRAASDVPDVVGFAADNGGARLMAVPGGERQVEVWDLERGELVATLGEALGLLEALAVDASGTRIAAAHGKSVEIWSLTEGESLRRFEHDSAMGSVAFLDDGARLLTGDAHGDIHLWALDGGAYPELTLPAPQALCATRACRVDALTVDVDQTTVVASLGERRFAIWSLRDGTLESTFRLDLTRAVLSGDGQRAFLVSSDGGVVVLDVEARRPLEVLAPQRGKVFRLWPSHDGEYVLLGYEDETYSLYQVRGALEVVVLEPGVVLDASSIAFAPDDRVLAFSRDNGQLAAVDPTTGLTLFEVPSDTEGYAHALGFSPDGHLLAVARGTLRLLEGRTGRVLASLAEPDGDAMSVRFAPDGRTLAWGDSDGQVHIARLAAATTGGDEASAASAADDGAPVPGQLAPGTGGCACSALASAQAPWRGRELAVALGALFALVWLGLRRRNRTTGHDGSP